MMMCGFVSRIKESESPKRICRASSSDSSAPLPPAKAIVAGWVYPSLKPLFKRTTAPSNAKVRLARDLYFQSAFHSARDLEFEVQSRNLVSRMIVGVRELRYAVEELRFFWRSLVDAGKKIDQVLADVACRSEIDDHVSLRVEAAGIAHVGIIVCRRINIVVLGPADAFQVNRDGSSRGSGSRSHTDNTGFDSEVSPRDRFVSVAELERVLPTEILWNGDGKFDFSITAHLDLSNDIFLRRVTIA